MSKKGKILDVKETVERMELDLAKIKLVREKYPNCKVQDQRSKRYWYEPSRFTFSDKSVKSTFNSIEVCKGYNELYLKICDMLRFSHNGTEYKVEVNCVPNTIKIAYVGYKRVNGKYTIKFKRITRALKAKLDYGKVAKDILDFISANSEYQIDYTDLDPRLKKLMIFS